VGGAGPGSSMGLEKGRLENDLERVHSLEERGGRNAFLMSRIGILRSKVFLGKERNCLRKCVGAKGGNESTACAKRQGPFGMGGRGWFLGVKWWLATGVAEGGRSPRYGCRGRVAQGMQPRPRNKCWGEKSGECRGRNQFSEGGG